MDSNGVPQKINRHVFKAVTHYSLMRKDGTKFSEVLEYVRLCNRNLKPVANLKTAVRKALENFQKFGLIQKDKNSRYKIIKLPIHNEDVNSTTLAKKKTVEPREDNSRGRDIDPNSRKRNFSNDSIGNEDIESTRKRFRTEKNLKNRDGKKANIPKSRRSNINTFNFDNDISNYRSLDLNDNEIPTANYNEDESQIREPGADDRDSGDDLHVKSRTSFSQDNVTNGELKKDDEADKNENSPPKPESDGQNEKNDVTNNIVEHPGTSTSFAKNSLSFRPYLN